MKKKLPKFIDIGANLLDDMFQGIYHGSNKHKPDLDSVLERAWSVGLTHIIVTAGNLEESTKAFEFVQNDARLFSTVGVHPTRCNEFDDDHKNECTYLTQLIEIAKQGAKSGKVVAIGECGLDYERIQFCDKQTQLKHFEKHFKLVEETGLPMFLHNRRSTQDLYRILKQNRNRWKKAVVHSFTDSVEDMKLLLSLDGVYIGINGCSLKTEENLNVLKEIPSNRLMIETDAPWCGIKKSHAASKYVKTTFDMVSNKKHCVDKCVKGRSEPGHIVQVLEVIAGVKGEDVNELCETIYANTLDVFFANTVKNDDRDDVNEWQKWFLSLHNNTD